jgi:hypothetical protein
MSRPNWAEIKDDFAWDGSLRDIYILDTDANDWDVLLAAIRSSNYERSYRLDGELAALPESFASALSDRARASAHLTLRLAEGLTVDCFFFSDEQIEFSLDPREIRGEYELEKLLSFIAYLGQTVRKKVLLTPENGAQFAFLEFDPSSVSWARM